MKYEADLDKVGLYPCVKIETYKCDDGREVLDPTECDKKQYKCDDGRMVDDPAECLEDTEQLPCDKNLPRNPETGRCPPPDRVPPIGGGECPPGTEPDPVFSAFGLTVCRPKDKGGGGGGGNKGGGDKGGGGEPQCKPHQVEYDGQCFDVCNEGETYNADRATAGLNPCVKPGDDGDTGGEEKPAKKCREDEVQEGEMCYGTCPDNSTYTRSVDGDYPCSGRGGDGEEYDPGGGEKQPQCRAGEYFDMSLNGCVPVRGGAPVCFDDAGRPRVATYEEQLYGCMSKNDIENMASGGTVKKKSKKYQAGGIASLTRDPRLGGAVNPAAGYNFGFAGGGMAAMPEYRAGGKLLRGEGDGMSDDIPAVIRGKGVQRAALADGEFVIPADVVSHLGNGSTEAGAKKLYKMMAQIRRARTGKKKQAPRVNPDKYLPRV